ncbi:MAG: sterol carrier protein domain-containing protein, partial [Chloroflexota bacterium]
YKISGNMHGGEMSLNNIFWTSLAARNRLFGYIAMHDVNLPTTAMAVPMGINFQTWFKNPTQNYEATIDYVSMMCRVVDPIGAIEGLPAAVNGRLQFQYRDAQCPWTEGSYELVGENGRLHLHKTSQTPANQLDAKGLSALVFGTLSAEEVVFRQWGNVSEDDVQLLSRWFPTAFTFNTNKF